ncbi:MAG TPA: sigma 54-interacting transcriptional regulator [Syntrophales bacterium]|nr:sigma 54-interacting transcriptional regulator [Syntrophales bacterium]HPQ44671.1 sigma 54-interacting transcriptional regulator [Syntrophales bacterium]
MPHETTVDSLSYLSRDLIAAALENPYECPMIIDSQGKICFMSRFSPRLIGINPSDVIGKPLNEVIKNSHLHEVLKTGKARIGESIYIGGKQQIIANIPLKDHNGKVIGALGKGMFNETSKIKTLLHEIEILKTQIELYRNSTKTGDFLAGKSEPILEVQKSAIIASTSDAPVLITGETGTGKEIVAHYIHKKSRRADCPFIRVNCAAIPEELFESELFGYEKGSFTGASSHGKKGKFELAHGSTILLDEIGELPLRMQAKLLRVLQEYAIDRIGGTQPVKVDFRLIASTNQDLQSMINNGLFRKDLFYRINIFHITTPNLRDIPEDIPLISSYLMSHLRGEVAYGPTKISDDAMDVLKGYDWPGNVRELRNVLERAMITGKGKTIRIDDFPRRIREQGKRCVAGGKPCSLRRTLEDTEKVSIIEALRSAEGNKAEASKRLGIHRTGLYQKIKKYHIGV